MDNIQYIGANPENGKKFFQDYTGKGKITMLNLLKFKAFAEYEISEVSKTSSATTGSEAYQLYLNAIKPTFTVIGGSIIFQGDCKQFLIGPERERWDKIVLVQYASVQKFVAFSQSKAYLENVKHRTAALEDSRLLPIIEQKN